MIRRVALLLLFIMPCGAQADALPAYTEPTLFDCGQDKPLASFAERKQCATRQLAEKQQSSTPGFTYSPQAARYFYDGLRMLTSEGVQFTSPPLSEDDAVGPKPLSDAAELFRAHLQEFAFFNLPLDGDPSFNELTDYGLGMVDAYPVKDGFLIVSFAALGASDSTNAIGLLTNRGLEPVKMEVFTEKGQPLSVESASTGGNYAFDPKSGILQMGGKDGCCAVYERQYRLSGTQFALIETSQTTLDDPETKKNEEKTTILYRAKKK